MILVDDLSIKVKIANRVYPLTIKRSEEESIRKAAKLLNDNMTHLEENYAVRDRQDLLAMTALQYANEALRAKASTRDDQDLENLQKLEEKLGDYLSRQ